MPNHISKTARVCACAVYHLKYEHNFVVRSLVIIILQISGKFMWCIYQHTARLLVDVGWIFFLGGGHLQPRGWFECHYQSCHLFHFTYWARFMCHHELWSTSMSHPSSSIRCSSGLAAGKLYQKLSSLSLLLSLSDIFFKILLILFHRYRLILLTLFCLVCYCIMWLYCRKEII